MTTNIKTTKLTTTILTASATMEWRDQMWNLYNRYYNTDQKAFFNRFNSNNFYAIYTYGKELVGFTGFRINAKKGQKKYNTIYIGQTVMDATFRGKSLIPRTCCLVFAKMFIKNPFTPIYVWVDALTYKPYLLFANSFECCYPSRKNKTPNDVKTLMDELGTHYYGENYNPDYGTVRKMTNVINDPSTLISEKDRQHPDIDFYANANPNYVKGHGLITMAPVNLRNFLYLIKKCIKKSLGK